MASFLVLVYYVQNKYRDLLLPSTTNYKYPMSLFVKDPQIFFFLFFEADLEMELESGTSDGHFCFPIGYVILSKFDLLVVYLNFRD